ncbi:MULTISPECIES: PepSY domain-containing protein [Pseudomonadaceae]|uniref:PepSY domain-containing protein n=1 Tax=Pseudomonadaceae TaxID=135621 RepID=UPI00187D2C2C|nr:MULTISPECIES: PepSY domain-containing protein [Pseudomonadaceae]MBE7929108.1 PepSY domain-containing protein [Pseudomonas saudiphocaensis]MCF6782745.1 PepSY domain-containing protein [Stutzerimonas stutzeri]MCF6805850.1 PepSY domain-containing protein [Stutzerimonas stutzeri]
MRSTLLILPLALLLAATPAASRDLDQDEALQLRREGRILPLESLLQQVQQRYPGARLLEAELEEEDGLHIYEIELLTADGIARELELDARDGRLIKDEED